MCDAPPLGGLGSYRIYATQACRMSQHWRGLWRVKLFERLNMSRERTRASAPHGTNVSSGNARLSIWRVPSKCSNRTFCVSGQRKAQDNTTQHDTTRHFTAETSKTRRRKKHRTSSSKKAVKNKFPKDPSPKKKRFWQSPAGTITRYT